MKSAKSLTSALHSLSLLSSLLFLTLFGSSAHFPLFALPAPPLSTVAPKNSFVSPPLVTSVNNISEHFAFSLSFLHIFTSSFTSLLSSILIFSHLFFARLPLLHATSLIAVLALSLFKQKPIDISPPHTLLLPSQGSGHLIYRACLLHLSLHFPPAALTDRSPFSLRVHIDHSAWERGMLGGKEEEGEYTLRTVVAKQTVRWEKACGGKEGGLEWTERPPSVGDAGDKQTEVRALRGKMRNWEIGWQLSLNIFFKMYLA